MNKYRPSRLFSALLQFVPKMVLKLVIKKARLFECIENTKDTQVPIIFEHWYQQYIQGHCSNVDWPVNLSSMVSAPDRIKIGIETSPGYMPGCYIQGYGGIEIGDYTQIGPNVSIISANHSLHDSRRYEFKKVIIGNYCWLSDGCKILPGVVLGDFTIVAAGAIVTKSFENGYVLIGGNPAKILKSIEKEKCIMHQSKHQYIGYRKVNNE